jgi:trimeric autotransporter adhesin
MSTKTLRKRIALVAVSALGFGLVSVVPAFAAAAAIEFGTGSAVLHRTDAAADSTFQIQANGAQSLADTKQLDLSFTRNGVAISGVPGGITINWDDTQTSTVATAGTEAGNVLSADMDVADFADNAAIAVITVGRTMAPGKYTVAMTPETTLTVSNALTFYVATAPTTLSLDKTSYAMDATASTPDAVLTIKDAQANPTYLIPGEAIDLTITGGVTGATKPTVAPGFLDSVTAPNTATTVALDLATSTATTGTYTLTVARAAGLTGVANATASIVVGSVPKDATGLKFTSVADVNSDQAAGADSAFDGTDDNAVAAAGTAGTAYLSTSTLSKTYRASTSDTSGTLRFTIATYGTGLAAGLTAGSTDVAIVADGLGGYYADFTVASTAPAAGFGYSVTVEAGANDFTWNVKYQTPAATWIDVTDSLLTDGSFSAVAASTNSVTAVVYDQFDNTMSGVGVNFVATGRNAANKGAVTDASGTATYTWTDTSIATLLAAPSTTVTASLASAGTVDGFVEDTSVAVTVNYKSSIEVSTVTLSGNIPSKSATANSISYASAISTLGTTSAVLKTNTTALAISTTANVGATDQAVVKVVAKDSLGNAVAGVRVTFAGSTGVFFGSAQSASLTSAASIVPVAGATAVTTKDVYTDSSGEAFIQARFTKVGSGTVTATSYGVTSTALAVTVTNAAADARYIATTAATGSTLSNAVASFTVTDGFGNVVSGVDVKFGVSGVGTFLNGTNSVTGTTDASGVVTAALTSATAGTATVTGTVTTSSQAASETAASTTLGFAKGVKSATSTVTMAVTKSAAELAIDALAAQIAANKAASDAQIAADKAASDAKIALLQAALDAAAVKAAADKVLTDAAIAAAQAASVAAAEAAADAAAEAIDAGNNAFDAATSAGEAADAATAAAEQAGEDATAAATAAGEAAVAAAEAAQEAAAEATDAANAATDAANASAEAADAATAAAQDAADAVAALSTQVSEMVSALKKQITALTNLVIKIQKKVRA